MRKIDVAERRARLAVRHRLAVPANDPVEVARALVGIHSTDPASVFLAARARTEDAVPEDLERALYEDRSLARVLGMRRTMFVVPTELVPVIHAAAARALAAGERSRTVRMLEDADIARDGVRWLAKAEEDTLAALSRLGEATAAELSRKVPQLREQIPVGTGKKWQGTVGVSTRVLFLLATEGRVVRARPRGSWTSTQYRWTDAREWLGIDPDSLPTDAARAELTRLWLAAFGPGTFEDLKWWTGWTVAQARAALAGIGAEEVDLGGATGFVLPGDDSTSVAREGWVAFLPALDSTVMGWKEREWFLGPHREVLFDRNGNAGPTIWSDGRVVGGWAQRRDGEIAIRILEDVGSDAAELIGAEAARLRDWLGDVRFVQRFRTPLERELSAD